MIASGMTGRAQNSATFAIIVPVFVGGAQNTTTGGKHISYAHTHSSIIPCSRAPAVGSGERGHTRLWVCEGSNFAVRLGCLDTTACCVSYTIHEIYIPILFTRNELLAATLTRYQTARPEHAQTNISVTLTCDARHWYFHLGSTAGATIIAEQVESLELTVGDPML